MHWFTADLHLGHGAVIEMCNRPFADLAAMDAHLLCAIHECVGHDHDLWILGDFALVKDIGDARERIWNFFTAIPGRKHLIIGNHDRRWVRELPWTSVAHFRELIVDQRRISLSHYPMVTFPGAGHGALQLFGHVHRNWAGSRNSVNVGVDQWHYRPVSLRQQALMERPDQLSSSRSMSGRQLFSGAQFQQRFAVGFMQVAQLLLVFLPDIERFARSAFSIPRRAPSTHPSISNGERSKLRLASATVVLP